MFYLFRPLFVPNQGMVDPGDNVTNTLKKEFGEEALNSLELSPEENKKIHDSLEDLFCHGTMVIKKSSQIIFIISLCYFYSHFLLFVMLLFLITSLHYVIFIIIFFFFLKNDKNKLTCNY